MATTSNSVDIPYQQSQIPTPGYGDSTTGYCTYPINAPALETLVFYVFFTRQAATRLYLQPQFSTPQLFVLNENNFSPNYRNDPATNYAIADEISFDVSAMTPGTTKMFEITVQTKGRPLVRLAAKADGATSDVIDTKFSADTGKSPSIETTALVKLINSIGNNVIRNN